MNLSSLYNLDFFTVLGDSSGQLFHGCKQEWFSTHWQRLSGCGPAAATTIIYYLGRTQGLFGLSKNDNSLQCCKALMEEVWTYVTPTIKGMPTTKMFYEGVLLFAKHYGVNNLKPMVFDVPKLNQSRPELQALVQFIEGAMKQNAPVAFLNLCNGKEENLERWHWVTVVSIGVEDAHPVVTLLDEGKINATDLALWYKTTKKAVGSSTLQCNDTKFMTQYPLIKR